MKGFKAFNADWTCRDFQYEVGKTYEMKEEPVICERGFHFCKNLVDCFEYYNFESTAKIAEIEAMGEIDDEDGKKYCTNKIKIIKEIPWEEVLQKVNIGNNCTGIRNSGNWNSGHCNSGDWNSGDWNSGHCNSGDWNSGHCNSGNRNSGDWNITSHSTGCFNTKEQTLYFFNKPSNWNYKKWIHSDAEYILSQCPQNRTSFIPEAQMTEEEKKDNPSYKTTRGYLKQIIVSKEEKQEWWDRLCKEAKNEILSLPNFDKEIFREITGITVAENYEF